MPIPQSMNNDDRETLAFLGEKTGAIKQELSKRIIGHQGVIDDLLACFLSGGHCLLIGVPGLAKTMLVQSLGLCCELSFNRIQFTPDLMPADITGSEILIEDKATGRREFTFLHGPIFHNIVLADEINRTPPKTQSALLQAMQEHQVTSSGKTYPLPSPFWVLATQNPIEQEGTYPLPEAQQDRFMFSIEIGYPTHEDECEIVKQTTAHDALPLHAVLEHENIERFRTLIRNVPVADSVIDFAVSLIRSTRPGNPACPKNVAPYLVWGAGPRASQYLILAAKSYAVLDNRPTPDTSDVQRAAYPVLRHRLVRSFQSETENIGTNDIIALLMT